MTADPRPPRSPHSAAFLPAAAAAPLRVLNVHSGNLYGGIEVFHSTMAPLARPCGIDEEFALCFEGRPADELRAAGVVVHPLGEVHFRRPLEIARARRALSALLARRRPDVVVSHSAWSYALFAGTIRASGLPLVLHLHDSVGKIGWLERLARLTRPDAVVANSAFTAGTVDRLFPGVTPSIVTYPVSLRPPPPGARADIRSALGVPAGTVVILQASRMQSWKGHELHIDALARLRTRAPWVCWMAGGAQRPEEEAYAALLRRKVDDAGLGDRVKFLGQRGDVPALMAGADVFCQPNKTPEPFGIVFIEALAAGLPVVAVDMGGAAEIVTPSCGMLAPPGDVDAVAAALTKLVDDEPLRVAMSAPATRRARELCEPETQVRRLEEVMTAVAREATGPSARTGARPTPAPLRRRPYVVVASDFIRTGGMDRANHALARHLARRGHETHVVSFRVADDLAREPNVHVHIAPRPAGKTLLGGPFLGSLGLFEALRHGRGAEAIVNGGNCPAPGAVNWVHYVHAASAARALSGRPQPKSWIAQTTERIALSGARLVLANSERTRRDLAERVGVDDSRIRVVYLGVDADEFRPRSPEERAEIAAAMGWSAGRRKVVFVGGLGDERKGFRTLYAAWRSLCRSPDWDADLVVVGTGKQLPSWRDRAQADGLADRVAFLGLRSDVPRIVGASHLLVAPSLYEPYGLATHEALCCAVPAITSAESGAAEVYPDALSDLLLPDPADDVDLARRIRRWRDGDADGVPPPALRALSDRLRARTWDDVARDIVDLCER